MTKSRLFQIAAIWNPSEKEEKDGLKAKVIVEIETILCNSESQANMQAVMKIPKEYAEQLDQIDVVVRSF